MLLFDMHTAVGKRALYVGITPVLVSFDLTGMAIRSFQTLKRVASLEAGSLTETLLAIHLRNVTRT